MINVDVLNQAWQKVVADYSDRPRLRKCLESANLHINSDGSVCFSVSTQGNKDLITENVLDDIQRRIRDYLGETSVDIDVLTTEEMKILKSYYVSRNSWKSKDLERICACSNTDGVFFKYCFPIKEDARKKDQLRSIQNKIKKIGPSKDHIIVNHFSKGEYFYVTVVVRPSKSICYVSSRSGIKTYYYLIDGKVIKTTEEEIEHFKSIIKGRVTKTSITRITSMMTIPDVTFIENHSFKNGDDVPIFEAFSVYGFNRLVGYLKYLNRAYGNVYSRGECKLHTSLIPSLYRDKTDLTIEDGKITTIYNRFLKDPKLSSKLSLSNLDSNSKYIVEGVLQHYGAPTSFLDVVDNHWVALWMGLNKYTIKGQLDRYASYIERSIPEIERISGDSNCQDPEQWKEMIYQYVLLVAVPYVVNQPMNGVGISNSIIEVDLRKALPSTFLRPHAQHGLVIKKNITNKPAEAKDYDLSSNVVAIIRVRIDRSKKWIGDGELLTQNNLIPPPGYDPGYDLLLNKSEIFKNSPLKIVKYE